MKPAALPLRVAPAVVLAAAGLGLLTALVTLWQILTRGYLPGPALWQVAGTQLGSMLGCLVVGAAAAAALVLDRPPAHLASAIGSGVLAGLFGTDLVRQAATVLAGAFDGFGLYGAGAAPLALAVLTSLVSVAALVLSVLAVVRILGEPPFGGPAAVPQPDRWSTAPTAAPGWAPPPADGGRRAP